MSRKKMKVLKSIAKVSLAILAIGIFVTCKKEFVDPVTVEPSHSVVYTSHMGKKNTINVDESIDFKDISQGVVSRTWTFPSSNVEVVGEASDEFVQVYFLEPGSYDVSLSQQFKSDAYSAKGETPISGQMDTTITVTVLPHVEISNFKAFKLEKDGSLGQEYALQNDAKTELPAGTTVRYTFDVNTSYDELDGDFSGATLRGQNVEENYFDLRYSSLKSYNIQAILSRTYPVSNDTINFNSLFVGIPSDEPVEMEVITDYEGAVSLMFSRDIDGASIKAEEFEVEIYTKNGATINATIEEAKLGRTDDEVLLLLQGESIYSDDSVVVSYTKGTLQSTDAMLVETYSDQHLVQTETNVLEEWGYDWDMEQEINWGNCPDVPSTSGWSSWTGWFGNEDKFIDEANTHKSTAYVKEGTQSLKLTINPYIENIPPEQTENMPNKTLVAPILPTGDYQGFTGIEVGETYKISCWVYTESDGGEIVIGGFKPNLRIHVIEATGWSEPAYDNWLEEGTWKKAEQFTKITKTSQPVDFAVMFSITQTSDAAVVTYFDDLRMVRWNARP